MHSSGSTSNMTSFNPTTSKYYVNFGGKTIETTVTDKAAIANQWANDMLIKYGGEQTHVGLDIEWRPNYVPNTSNKAATLQLCIDDKCLIVQLFYLDEIPQTLKTFLASHNFVFVGVEVDKDIRKLKDEYGLVCNQSVDLRDFADDCWPEMLYGRPGLKRLASEICGLYMPKPKHVCMSNWEARVLSLSQIEYACIDAYASYKVSHQLLRMYRTINPDI